MVASLAQSLRRPALAAIRGSYEDMDSHASAEGAGRPRARAGEPAGGLVMSLYEALEELVGAGVLACAPACDIAVAPGKVVEGGRFLVLMRERGAAAFITPVIDALSREIWLGRDSRGVPHQVSEAHARALVAVLEMNRPEPQEVAGALEKARSGAPAGPDAEPPSRAIALNVFARSRAGGGITQSGLWDEIALFLLERLFAHLLDDPSVLEGLRPAIVQFLAPEAEPTAAAASARAPAKAEKPRASAPLPRVTAARPAPEDPVQAVAERHQLARAAVDRLAAHVDRESVRAELRLARLDELARWVAETRAQLLGPSNDDSDVRRQKSRAAAALGEGNFEEAMDALRHVRRAIRDGRRRVEERLQEEVAGLRQRMSDEALATGRLGEIALARGDHDGAIDLFGEALESLPANDPANAWRYTVRLADARARKGEAAGDQAMLAAAVESYGEALKLISAAGHPAEWMGTNFGLGNAIMGLAERDKGIERLGEAVAAFRRALAVSERGRDARRATDIQLRLGQALGLIAERAGRVQAFKEAIDAYRAAVAGLSRESAPREWAAAQMGLGTALLGLEEQQNSRELLSEAAQAFAEALVVLTREREAADWATGQMSLGNALLGLGELEGLSARLEDAVVAYRQALKVFTREAEPKRWALAQMNLANALASLGDRDPSATARLEDAIKAYGLALEVFTRDAEPLKWAIAQMNLGTALVRLGERKDKRQSWLAAAAAMVPALEVFETQGATEYADLTRRNLRKFHEQWEQLIGDPAGSAPGRSRVAKLG